METRLQPYVTMTVAIKADSPRRVAAAIEHATNALAQEGFEPQILRWQVGADPVTEEQMEDLSGLGPGSQN